MPKVNAPRTAMESDAEGKINFLFFGGLVLLAVGMIVLGLAWGSAESEPVDCTDDYAGEGADCDGGSGRTVAFVAGGMLAGFGQMAVLTAIIGYGVFIGIARAGGWPVSDEPDSQSNAGFSVRPQAPAGLRSDEAATGGQVEDLRHDPRGRPRHSGATDTPTDADSDPRAGTGHRDGSAGPDDDPRTPSASWYR